MQDWIKEAIVERFDVLSAKAEQMEEYVVLREQASGIEQIWVAQLSESDRHLFNEWLDLHVQMVSVQKQWLFVKGVQDGIRLLITLLFSEDNIDSI